MPRRLRRCARVRPGFVERTSLCVQRTRAHRARDPTDIPSCPRRGKRGPEDHGPDQEHGVEGFLLLRAGARCSGFSGSPLHCGGSGRKRPQGRRDGSRRFRCLDRDVQSTEPDRRRGPEAQDARRVQCSGACLFAYFLCTSRESKTLARRASGSSCSKTIKGKSWIPACPGMTSKSEDGCCHASGGNSSIAITMASSRPFFAG